jgi:voltage-gated potassium channel
MAEVTVTTRQHSTSYNIFILVLTVLSLGIMVWMLFPISEVTWNLLNFYMNAICFIFLFDFFRNLSGSQPKSAYFIKERGWLDLIGSIPTLGIFRLTGLLRLARLSRLARITRLLRGKNKDAMLRDIIENRSQYTLFITVLLTFLVLTVASVLVLQFESKNPDANIHTGWDSFWYSIVTITTVGYGDRYPITVGGRITAMFIMFMGVGIIGALASILSSLLVGSPPAPAKEEPPAPQVAPKVEEDIAAIRSELAALRQMLEKSNSPGEKQ